MVCLKERICLLKSCFFSALFIFCLIFSLSYCSNPSGGDGEEGKPGLTGTLTINNTSPEVGDTLTASYEGGNGSGEAAWQWLADGKPIEGANSTTYIVADSDLGKPLAARVSFSDQDGSISSDPTAAIAKTLKSIAELREFLETHTGTQSKPLPLKLVINLGQPKEKESGWRDLLAALDEAGDYVALDLSACTMIGKVFDHSNMPIVFSGMKRIVAISLPDAVKEVGFAAFNRCSSLTEVSAPKAITIGDYAFQDCTSLTRVSFPEATGIGGTAFHSCTSLTKVSFPEATSIGDYAFYGCSSLTEVSLPVTTSIGYCAFGNCTSLAELSFPKATSIDYSAFRDCTSLTRVSFPEVTSISHDAFKTCPSLTEVSAPKARTIDYSAFQDCTSLTRVSFPEVTSIGHDAFYGCTSLTEVSFPEVTSIDSFAFVICNLLKTITLGDTAPKVGAAVFFGVSGRSPVTVKIPADATGYGTVPATYSQTSDHAVNWANGFRGLGWDGTGFTNSYGETPVTLVIEEY